MNQQEMEFLLPLWSAHKLPSDGSAILIKRGQSGYYPLSPNDDAEQYNRDNEVTPAQAEAMFQGSMFGWDNKMADPRVYEEARYSALLANS